MYISKDNKFIIIEDGVDDKLLEKGKEMNRVFDESNVLRRKAKRIKEEIADDIGMFLKSVDKDFDDIEECSLELKDKRFRIASDENDKSSMKEMEKTIEAFIEWLKK